MARHILPTFAAAMALLGASASLGEDGAAGASAAGDWNCRIGGAAVGTLSVRASSYMLNRFGTVMGGEYEQAERRITVSNGPLVGMGVGSGVLAAADAAARTLEFHTARGAVLSCREVL